MTDQVKKMLMEAAEVAGKRPIARPVEVDGGEIHKALVYVRDLASNDPFEVIAILLGAAAAMTVSFNVDDGNALDNFQNLIEQTRNDFGVSQ